MQPMQPLRRVTVTVPRGHLDAVRTFYTQLLGWRVFYEAEFSSEGEAALLGMKEPVKTHLVVLQSGSSTTGMIGLIEYLRPELDIKPFEKREGMPFPLFLVIHAENIPEIHRQAVSLGYTVVQKPREGNLPGKGLARDMVLLDPNGVYLEMTEPNPKDSVAPQVMPVRRVTFPIARGKMEKSLAFYQQLLGMQVFYDHDATGQASTSSLGVGDWRMHMIALQPPGGTVGMIGLMEYLQPVMDVRPFRKSSLTAYPITLVYVVNDVNMAHQAATDIGVEIVCPPMAYPVPERGQCIGMSCLDPNGVLLDFTQFPS